VILSIVILTLSGRMPDSQAGWLTNPPPVIVVTSQGRRNRPCGSQARASVRDPSGDWLCLLASWYLPMARSLLLTGLCRLSGHAELAWLRVIPWGLWLWQLAGWRWPGLRRQPEWQAGYWLGWQAQQLAILGNLILVLAVPLSRHLPDFDSADLNLPVASPGMWLIGLGCAVCGREEARVEVTPDVDGGWTATLCGHFTLRVAGDHPFRARLLRIFLRVLTGPGPQRSGRRTRDGRTPFVAQQTLAGWFQIPQPEISREEKYWQTGDWANLLSLHTQEVLTHELMARLVTVFVTFPGWHPAQVYHYLRGQGVAVSEAQVRQAAEQSGWNQLQAALVARYHVTAEGLRPRDSWLTQQLLAQVEQLVRQLEAGAGLTPEQQVAVADLRAAAAENQVVAPPPLPALPWLMRIERLVLGAWQEVDDDTVACIYCGSHQVIRKSNQPRVKQYYDADGQIQRVAVYRYYCRNPHCDRQTFTHLPPGLVPYSRYRTEAHLRVLQMYGWGRSVYRRTGAAMGVSSMTAYRWVSAWGYGLLPVAALFGVVKSSGVVGIDEKYVLVPKSDKPAGEMRRWMYVYLAVDVYTYDLLHIAIYPHNNQDSARAFLWTLRAKGYHPRVIVTDLRQDYGGVIAQVYPHAEHHECIFHALKDVQTQCKAIYGKDYARTHPEAEALKHQIYDIFAARSRRTAIKRYAAVMALREEYVRATPGAAGLFDFLERHWPKLVNGIESDLIPTTNNAVEMVIRRFDQHYQNYC
jgi:hypothetical protein